MNKRILTTVCVTTTLLLITEIAPATVPTTPSGFGFTIEGLYLQPSSNNLNYAVSTEPLPVPAPSWTQNYINPDYQAAFRMGLQYTLANSVDQIKIDWLYVNTADNASVSAGGTTSVTPPYYFGPGAQALRGTSAKSNVIFNINDVSVSIDHLIEIGHYILLDPFVGLNSAFLTQKISSSYIGTDSLGANYSIDAFNKSQYMSAGPRLGLNAVGYIGSHFGILASMAASLLVGTVETDTNFLSYGAGNSTAVKTNLANENQTLVVPEFESRLGLLYTIPLRQNKSVFIFQAGYLFMTYLNGINQVFPTALVPDAFNQGTVAISTSTQQPSNLNLNGPYFNVTVTF